MKYESNGFSQIGTLAFIWLKICSAECFVIHLPATKTNDNNNYDNDNDTNVKRGGVLTG